MANGMKSSLKKKSNIAYPGKMDTDLIQEAFREADTVRAGIFLGNAAVHRNSTWTYYFPDVEKISTEEEGV